MKTTSITIVICTWNREAQLKVCLAALAQLDIPPNVSWEVLVINNNSTDGTDAVVRSFEGKLPLRCIFEAQQGKSNALNTAIRNAVGEYLLFTDDDVVVERDWLSAYVEATRQWPNASLFGGPIEVEFDGQAPAWLREAWPKVKIAYAARDLGNKTFEFDHAREENLPFGANYAVRRAEQQKFPYDPSLGPTSGTVMLGEEIAVMKAMLAAGCEGHWVPEAGVRHVIPAQRQTECYLRRRYAYSGKMTSLASMEDSPHKILGIPRWVLLKTIVVWLRYVYARQVKPPSEWIDNLIDYGFSLGALSAWISRSPTFRYVVRKRH